MSDRELLELAAKAAGYEVQFKRWSGFERMGLLCWRGTWSSGERAFIGMQEWNPLTDDGDALRLAVKLGMEVYVDCHPGGCACTEAQSHMGISNARTVVNHESDADSATRHAIVILAAEIGKAMP